MVYFMFKAFAGLTALKENSLIMFKLQFFPRIMNIFHEF